MKKIDHQVGSSVAEATTGSSVWFVQIAKLGDAFEAYRSAPLMPARETSRSRFYQVAWELTEVWARITLRAWDWKGDVAQDAKDITAAFCEGLLKQEQSARGLFGTTQRSASALRGYLSQTIRKGVSQQAGELARKRRSWLHFGEDAVLDAATARQADWLPVVLRLTKAIGASRKRVKELPADEIGTTPLEFVLQLALDQKVQQGGALKVLLESAPLTKRTRQRRKKDFRDELRCELEM